VQFRARMLSLAGFRDQIQPRVPAILAACATLALALTVPLTSWYGSLRERAFDVLLSAQGQAAVPSPVVVIDMDRASLEQLGPWPWGRDRLAALIEAAGQHAPSAIALDVLLDGPDEHAPAALARKLARHTALPAIAELAATLPDGDAALVAAVSKHRVVLGLALDPSRRTDGGLGRPVRIQGAFDASALWQEPGFIGPPADLADAADGIGALVLAGEPDGSIRRVPMFVIAGNRAVPGLALELLRAARRVPLITVQDRPRHAALAAAWLPLDADAMLRLLPPDLASWPARTLSAADVLAGRPGVADAIAGRMVLIGSSAPESGGLRPLPTGDLAPTVQLQADALRQLARGYVPLRTMQTSVVEWVAVVAAALLGAWFGARLTPWRGALATAGVAALWLVAVGSALMTSRWLLDPVVVPAAALLAYTLSALALAAATARREAAIRQRFEQHLAPAVVRQIVAHPNSLKLQGEVRTITALFTDVEGFTALTDRAEPHQLIAVLDAYFDGVIRCVVDHGGLVDKIVGDAVHAIFNAPFDLAEHPAVALACGREIEIFAASFAREELPRTLNFGRTRIGIETGPAIVGDVGGARKLDYTAHGNAVNAAARLEAANKVLGTTIAIGPGAASHLPPDQLQPLGLLTLRGRVAPQLVYTLWPDTMGDADRVAWRAALRHATPADQLAALQTLQHRLPSDVPLQQLIGRLAG
jgi:adenylate cyclase